MVYSTLNVRLVTALQDAPAIVADDALISAHIPLVNHVVRETMNRVPSHVDRDDLVSAGLMALVKAAAAFDASRGVPFSAYAATRVRGAVLDELRGVDWASRSVRRTARSLDAVRSQLAVALGRSASDSEVAAALGITTEEVVRNTDDLARAHVLSFQASEDLDLEGLLPSAGPTPADVLLHRERLQYLVEAVAELPERQRTVVEQYFLAERPMADIAAELGVSESRVSQIRAEALVLLRGALNRELDPELEPAPARVEGCAARRKEAYYASVAARHASSMSSMNHRGAARVLDASA
ncbi:MAG: polymerase, sigma 28 subunit, SigD/FliA/WhiG [Marmoricola sp.]|nr:polymerase, sigma 28 subunit, SigD/FliA/WhiG [Marmoricola sp.]